MPSSICENGIVAKKKLCECVEWCTVKVMIFAVWFTEISTTSGFINVKVYSERMKMFYV